MSTLVYSFGIRVNQFKYIKSVHNIRTNIFPYRVSNDERNWDPPHDWNTTNYISSEVTKKIFENEHHLTRHQTPDKSVHLKNHT